MDTHSYITLLATEAAAASRTLSTAGSEEKNSMLEKMAQLLEEGRDGILAANALDLEEARGNGISGAMLDRLELTESRFEAMVSGVRLVAGLPDPVGEVMWRRSRPSGIMIEKRRVPLGVIAVVFESRPNVFIDTAALCLKAGNAIVLRGGKEALRTNKALSDCIMPAVGKAVRFIDRQGHDTVTELVRATGLVDIVIPRGGERLIKAVCEAALVPVLKHYKGVCHIYVDEKADLDMALRILDNAKTQRPGVCNAAECLLVNEKIADVFMPMVEEWARAKSVVLHTGEGGAEYLSLDINVERVADVGEAVNFINTHSSGHSDSIVTSDRNAAEIFLAGVDSSAVYHNVSTRFTDGAEFGMGAEIGISTDKLHARGPMGIEELTTYKYVITGEGIIRE